MNYLFTFLEGIITFISPCLLPMLPIYVSYFVGQRSDKKQLAYLNAIGFVLGFTLVFVSLGAFAGTIGKLLHQYKTAIQIISGIIVILFGLNFMDIIHIKFLNNNHSFKTDWLGTGFFSSILFGIIFSIGWTPCIGTFLGSALMLAATKGESIKGILMLLCYSLGLGIPFIVSAILIDKMKSAFDFIKKHYRIINLISGGLLVLVGALMISGLLGYFLSVLTF